MRLSNLLMNRNSVIALIFIVIFMGVVFSGCASTPKVTQVDAGVALTRAGFELKKADTPEKLEFAKSLPQEKLVRREKEGKIYYLYAKMEDCQCVYVGDESAHAELQKIIKEYKMSKKIDTTVIQSRTGLDSTSSEPTDAFGGGMLP